MFQVSAKTKILKNNFYSTYMEAIWVQCKKLGSKQYVILQAVTMLMCLLISNVSVSGICLLVRLRVVMSPCTKLEYTLKENPLFVKFPDSLPQKSTEVQDILDQNRFTAFLLKLVVLLYKLTQCCAYLPASRSDRSRLIRRRMNCLPGVCWIVRVLDGFIQNLKRKR
ncbi:hypothetical protein BDF21DRAFT_401601 [Thamnidium elegans]|nr:hypothetical protein BDF21DRAFT_401601 [Thamnidium elegans]